MELAGIKLKKLDTKAIASGLYDMFSDEDKTVMAFGMIPNEWIVLLKKQLKEKYRSILDENGFDKEACAIAESMGFMNQEKTFINEISNQVCKDLYSVARMVV